MASPFPDRLAAIDIGSNSIHLLIARVAPDAGGFVVLDRDKDAVRLGAGIGESGEIREDALTRMIVALKNFRDRARASGATIRAVATSAVREASNRDVIVERVRREVGLTIEVASGFEEARLTYLAVCHAVETGQNTALMLDIGGGSTEFVVGRSEEILFDDSLKLGAVRLSREFFPEGKTDGKAVAECRRFCALSLSPIRRGLAHHRFHIAIGSSGTALCLARMIVEKRGPAASARLNRVTFSAAELYDCVERILAAKTTAGRAKLKGVDEGRAEILAAGALIMEAVFRELALEAMTISEYSIREGIILDSIARLYQTERFVSHEGQRYRSVQSLAKRFDYELPHSEHVTRLALSIFDQTGALHGLGEIERELLEAASLLHDIGLFVSHAAHHKHSYYLIRNSQLLGFADYEQQIVALVARYHRKSPPRRNHLEFMAVPTAQQQIVMKLAGILRIADGLDRTHASTVKNVAVEIGSSDVVFRLTPAGRNTLEYAIWGAERKRDLFEEAFGRRVRFAQIETKQQ
ncbi:MAG: Ppx/GppA family phosphatase [bacterium]|nr:Ppx/GppA family phosphatase [bacterium]